MEEGNTDIGTHNTTHTSTKRTPHGKIFMKIKSSKPTEVRTTATEEENTEKIGKIVEKKEEEAGRITMDGAKLQMIWWDCRIILKIFLQYILYFGLMTTVSASFSCAESQTAELGKVGTIACSFPDNFHAVYWYGDAGDSGLSLITYTHRTEEKIDSCLGNESYDVFEDGSLLICNVTVLHEGNYTVILYRTSDFYEELTVFLRVIASPGNRSTSVQCDNCHDEHYHSATTGETLSCSFNVARPPVKIEWVQRIPQGDSLTATQEFKISNNSNGTYNSSANVRLLTSGDNQIAVFVCAATYLSSEWRRESEILLDFSQSESFSSVPSNTYYMETNRRAEIRCGEPDHIFRIWKRVPVTGEPETLGFRFDKWTEMINKISGIEISSEGNLVFPSPQTHHEGEYACIFSDGKKDQIKKTAVTLLIAPSPPYIKVTGCDDADNTCVLEEGIIQELTCSVDGVYPNATIEWISKIPSQISFFHNNTVIENIGQAYDVSVSVNYQVSADLSCEDEIYIECRLQGPISRIMKAERIIQLTPINLSNVGEVVLGRKMKSKSTGTKMGKPC